ncbi:TolB family protein [Synechocystis salina LEGE 00031]|uniref:TolB family protein n=2 Tax=Synechocystis TaxID=1142 RepID=A0ABR9VN13_9SYNC|nr:TolB family protein [Synechocystis salina LEGE 00041]MBE9252724.1 TolB family protein [Synechocystis salina LEGE 00031]
MNRAKIRSSLGQTPSLWLAMVLVTLVLGGCNNVRRSPLDQSLNSRFNDEQPSLSGDGRWLALVSNRNGTREILVYDLRNNQLVNLPGLNQANTIAESPSLSRTGRYLVYLSSIQGRPDIALYDRLTKKTDLLTLNYRQWVRNPKISPDGRYIVFETAKRGQWDIEILDRGPQIELDIAEGTPVENPPTPP